MGIALLRFEENLYIADTFSTFSTLSSYASSTYFNSWLGVFSHQYLWTVGGHDVVVG